MNTLVPPPMGLGRPSRQSIQYRLVIMQHPNRARCCGFGEKDKRPIDPPPILQLCVVGPDGSLVKVKEVDNVAHFIVQCDLYSVDQKHDRNIVYHPSSINPAYPNTSAVVMTFQEPTPVRNLLGTVVSSAYQLIDLDNEPGVFFVFPDLSVRTEGQFRLKFKFIDLSAGEPLTMSTQVLNEVFSEPFTVYSAKNFPGMTRSTALSQCFSKQGTKISVRKASGLKRSTDDIFGIRDSTPNSGIHESLASGNASQRDRGGRGEASPRSSSISNKQQKGSISSDGSNTDIGTPSAPQKPTTTPYSRIDVSTVLDPPLPSDNQNKEDDWFQNS